VRCAFLQKARLKTYNRRFITIRGVTNSITDWCKIRGLSYGAVMQRMRKGLPIEIALEKECPWVQTDIDGSRYYEWKGEIWDCVKTLRRNRKNHAITIDGVTKSMLGWAKHNGIPYATVMQRRKYGWDMLKAVTTSVAEGNQMRINCLMGARDKWYKFKPRYGKMKYEFEGESKTLDEWSKEAGVSVETLKARLKRGGNFAYALTGKRLWY